MEKLITEIAELVQDIEISRNFVHGLNNDIIKHNYKNAINNHQKLSLILTDINKKMTKLKQTMSEVENIINGLQ